MPVRGDAGPARRDLRASAGDALRGQFLLRVQQVGEAIELVGLLQQREIERRTHGARARHRAQRGREVGLELLQADRLFDGPADGQQRAERQGAFERAAAQPTADEAYAKGVEMTLSQFYACLARLGVKEIEAQGAQFDPNLHNAAMHVEQEGCDDNTIVEVFEKGFTMGEKVIRHAIVKVAN
ncbi:MAG: nucleotide exchange factor GrpE [Clostridia bacterium]|nr:nucleotide exchange factor GrpE [Clostridia bacterium]